jgi:hypothetical protein
VRQLKLEVNDPDRARRFESGRRAIDEIETFAARFAIPYERARRILVGPPGVFRPDGRSASWWRNRTGIVPTFGWVPIQSVTAYGAPAVHLAVEWLVRKPGRFEAACGRELTADWEVDRLSVRCSQCRGHEKWALHKLTGRLWEGKDDDEL